MFNNQQTSKHTSAGKRKPTAAWLCNPRPCLPLFLVEARKKDKLLALKFIGGKNGNNSQLLLFSVA